MAYCQLGAAPNFYFGPKVNVPNPSLSPPSGPGSVIVTAVVPGAGFVKPGPQASTPTKWPARRPGAAYPFPTKPGRQSLNVWDQPMRDKLPGFVRMPHSGAPQGGLISIMPDHYHALEGYADADGLGFSLKPPKFIRKLTLKKALPIVAIGAALLIPGALPLVAKGVVGVAKLATGAGRLVAKNVSSAISVFRPKQSAPPQTAVSPQVDVSQTKAPNPNQGPFTINLPGGANGSNAATTPAANPPLALTNLFQPSTSSLPNEGPEQGPDTAPSPDTTPQPAGFGGALVPLAIGAVGLIAVSSMLKKGRR